MTKKKSIITIVVILLAFWTVCGIGYAVFNAYFEKMERQEILAIVSDHLMSDAVFADKYGSVQSVTWNNDKEFVKVHGHECIVPCLITTSDDTVFEVDVRFNFENATHSFYYDSVTCAQ
ncbi:MAG: hypothetical protein IJW99_08700 [Clostridia bacterium]|nr:hypothetical protein [Clostridia bacterium]